MAVNSKVDLEWAGKPYSIKMTYELIDELECLGYHYINEEMKAKNYLFIKISRVISHLFKSAGADVSIGDIHDSIYGQGEINNKDIVKLFDMIGIAMAPELKKKPITRSPKKKKAKAKK